MASINAHIRIKTARVISTTSQVSYIAFIIKLAVCAPIIFPIDVEDAQIPKTLPLVSYAYQYPIMASAPGQIEP